MNFSSNYYPSVITGICAATLHARQAENLATRLKINSVPAILGVIDERVSYFKGPVSLHSLHEFTRNLFPNNFIAKVCTCYSCIFSRHPTSEQRIKC